jgi:hypothetical protein
MSDYLPDLDEGTTIGRVTYRVQPLLDQGLWKRERIDGSMMEVFTHAVPEQELSLRHVHEEIGLLIPDGADEYAVISAAPELRDALAGIVLAQTLIHRQRAVEQLRAAAPTASEWGARPEAMLNAMAIQRTALNLGYVDRDELRAATRWVAEMLDIHGATGDDEHRAVAGVLDQARAVLRAADEADDFTTERNRLADEEIVAAMIEAGIATKGERDLIERALTEQRIRRAVGP